MLALEVGRKAMNEAIIEAAMGHVFRNGKRWGRYVPNLPKDLRRIQTLLKRSEADWGLLLKGTGAGEASPSQTSGWIGQKETDLLAVYGNDFLEVVAILEYWHLWQYSSEILASLAVSKSE